MRYPVRRNRRARVVGIAFYAVGLVAIGLGWSGMARVACADCRLPGVVPGIVDLLSIVALGAGLLMLAALSAERRELEGRLDRFPRALGYTEARAAGDDEDLVEAHGPGSASTGSAPIP